MTATKLLVISLLFSSCATTQKQKIIENILIGAAIGFAAGQTMNQSKLGYSLMFAGLAGTGTAIGSIYVSDFGGENNKLKKDSEKLKLEIEQRESAKTLYQTSGLMSSKIPEKYKSMINPGSWKIYSLDQWIETDENKLIHQDQMMELTPPTLIPKENN